MRGSIPRADRLTALKSLVLQQGYVVTRGDAIQLLQWRAIKCLRWVLGRQPELAREWDPVTGNTLLHELSEVPALHASPQAVCEMLDAIVDAGAWIELRNADGYKAIELVERRYPRPAHSAIYSRFIDVGAWPIRGHAHTLADFEHKRRATMTRRKACTALFWCCHRKWRVPRDVAKLIAYNRLLWERGAWREW